MPESRCAFAKEVDAGIAGINGRAREALGDLFASQLREGIHPGAQLTVLKGDHVVIDRWGRVRDSTDD